MKISKIVIRAIRTLLPVLVLGLLLGCEKSPIEQAGIVVTDDMPKLQLAMVRMIPGEPVTVAKINIENGLRRLLAYHDEQQMNIPAVSDKEHEAYAVSFGVIVVPGMNDALDENHQKLQHYFLDYAKLYNQTIISARKNGWKAQ